MNELEIKTIPVIPLTKQFSEVILRISVTASMEVSDDVVLSNNAIIIVAFPLKNASLKSFGSISTGTETSKTLSYHKTFST